MRFEIHWNTGPKQDMTIVEGSTVEECRKKVENIVKLRGLTQEKNNIWSKEIK